MDSRKATSSSSHSRGEWVSCSPSRPITFSLNMIGMISRERVSSALAKNLSVLSFAFEVSLMRIGLVRSKRSAIFWTSIGMAVPSLFGTERSLRHSWLIRSSLPSISWSRSHRSASSMRPISETITFRNRSRSMLVGRSRARRSMMPSRASCILILRSSERDSGLSSSIFITIK